VRKQGILGGGEPWEYRWLPVFSCPQPPVNRPRPPRSLKARLLFTSCPVTRCTETAKTPFRAAALGVSVTSATLHSQKTPRGILPVNRSKALSNGKSCLHSRAFNVKLLVDSKAGFAAIPAESGSPRSSRVSGRFACRRCGYKMGPGRQTGGADIQ